MKNRTYQLLTLLVFISAWSVSFSQDQSGIIYAPGYDQKSSVLQSPAPPIPCSEGKELLYGQDDSDVDVGFGFSLSALGWTWIQADDFFVGPGEAFEIKEVKISIWSKPTNQNITEWQLSFYENNAGLPGNLIESQTIPFANVLVDPGISKEGFLVDNLCIPLNSNVILSGGAEGKDYWIGFHTPDDFTSLEGDFNDNIGPKYPVAYFRNDLGIWNSQPSGFSISFTLCGEGIPIPTLSQWGIIALGMLSMIFGVVMIRQRKVIFG